ncbi:hypothetical protein [Streptomyces bluensis]|uniref:hypothetical protein n=1 Tax=Streptomyces bluensis TaxID=33897 RepID=UPI001E3805A7|nr:hypothetical protein [Streptomyces bluensis]
MFTGTLDPHLARSPDDEWAQLATAQLTGVRAALTQRFVMAGGSRHRDRPTSPSTA